MATVVHLWLVTYDIRSDRVRNKIAVVLEGWGERVQYSVFECRLRETDVPKLSDRLKKVLRTKENGSVRMYRVCARCAAKSVGFGDIEPPDEEVAIVR
jgi:CRISPR-associated protein Cas2